MSDATDRAGERDKDLCDFRGIIVRAVWEKKLPSMAKDPLRLAWLAWAPADQPCERRRDVTIEILSEKDVAVGAKPDRNN